jgi:hypothetical protein
MVEVRIEAYLATVLSSGRKEQGSRLAHQLASVESSWERRE